jgi:hypothetical protein
MSKNPNVVSTVARIPKEKYLAFKAKARQENRSVNAQMNQLIDEYLQKQ